MNDDDNPTPESAPGEGWGDVLKTLQERHRELTEAQAALTDALMSYQEAVARMSQSYLETVERLVRHGAAADVSKATHRGGTLASHGQNRPEAANHSTTTHKIGELQRWSLDCAEAGAPSGQALLRPGQRLVLTNDGLGLAPLLAERLTARGVAARVGTVAEADALDGVIFLGGLGAPSTVDDAQRIVADAHRTIEAFREGGRHRDVVIVTTQETGGCFGLSVFDPVCAVLGSVAAGAGDDEPGARRRAVDLAWGDRTLEEVADVLANELFRPDEARQVGILADGRRMRPRWVKRPFKASEAAQPVQEAEVLLALCGADEASLAVVAELCAQLKPTKVLLCSHPDMPSDAVALPKLEGIEVKRLPSPASDFAATFEAIDQARRSFGAIDALVTIAASEAQGPALTGVMTALFAACSSDPLYLLGLVKMTHDPVTIDAVCGEPLRYLVRAEQLRRGPGCAAKIIHAPDARPGEREDLSTAIVGELLGGLRDDVEVLLSRRQGTLGTTRR